MQGQWYEQKDADKPTGGRGAPRYLDPALHSPCTPNLMYTRLVHYLPSSALYSIQNFTLGCIVSSTGTNGPVKNLPNTTLEETAKYGDNWILQTNTDHGKRGNMDRRTAGNECMGEAADDGSTSYSSMFDVLSTKPVLNYGTIYTSLMEVNSGKMETWLRGCKPACRPKKPPVTTTTTVATMRTSFKTTAKTMRTTTTPNNAAVQLTSLFFPIVTVFFGTLVVNRDFT